MELGYAISYSSPVAGNITGLSQISRGGKDTWPGNGRLKIVNASLEMVAVCRVDGIMTA